MRIMLLGPGRDSFREALDDADIHFEERPMRPQPGQIVLNSAHEVIQLAAPYASIATVLATVICTWLKGRASRKINITTVDNKVIQTEGLSVREFEEVLGLARQVMVIDTDKSAKKKNGESQVI